MSTAEPNPIIGNNKNSTTNTRNQELRDPFCILTPCIDSHTFDERKILVLQTEENAVKFGRSMFRQPSPNNAIFDCKVLSVNHAILWLDKEDRLLIKDVGSSNGTFVNNERLSASGEQSDAKPLFSGDILQLGVEVLDKNKRVLSRCIKCVVRLNIERVPQPDNVSIPLQQQRIPPNYTLVRNDKLFTMGQYVKEAKYRENLFGQKLQTLEEQLLIAHEALQAKWEEQVNQELLLSRIELLESQLAFFNAKKSIMDEDKMRQELQELVEDRAKSEQLAKDALRTKQEQLQDTSMKLHEAEMSLANVKGECEFLRHRCADFEEQLKRNGEDYESLMAKYNEVSKRLCAAEKAAIPAQTSSKTQEKNGGEKVMGNKVEDQNLNKPKPKSNKTEVMQQDEMKLKHQIEKCTAFVTNIDEKVISQKVEQSLEHFEEQICLNYLGPNYRKVYVDLSNAPDFLDPLFKPNTLETKMEMSHGLE